MIHLVTDRDVLAAYLEVARDPVDRVRASIRWVEAGGHRVLPGDYGVLPCLEWRADTRRRPSGVSPLGAVALAYQPPVRSGDMPEPAAIALGVPIPWVEGLADGFDGELPHQVLGPLARRRYVEGYQAGVELRLEMTLRCARDGVRHLRSEPCPLCEERS